MNPVLSVKQRLRLPSVPGTVMGTGSKGTQCSLSTSSEPGSKRGRRAAGALYVSPCGDWTAGLGESSPAHPLVHGFAN
jgi:hypothetical protein